MNRMRQSVARDRESMHKSLKHARNQDLYEENAFFTDPYTLKTGKKLIKGHNIVIAAGASPLIPDLDGLDHTDFLTNESVPKLIRKPDHYRRRLHCGRVCSYFSAMGTRMTIVQRDHHLVKGEEPEIYRLMVQNIFGYLEEIPL